MLRYKNYQKNINQFKNLNWLNSNNNENGNILKYIYIYIEKR